MQNKIEEIKRAIKNGQGNLDYLKGEIAKARGKIIGMEICLDILQKSIEQQVNLQNAAALKEKEYCLTTQQEVNEESKK